MTTEQRIKADLDHFFRTGEIPEPWAAIAPEPVDAEFDARVDEMNRELEDVMGVSPLTLSEGEHRAELEAIESGCVEPPALGWINRIGGRP